VDWLVQETAGAKAASIGHGWRAEAQAAQARALWARAAAEHEVVAADAAEAAARAPGSAGADVVIEEVEARHREGMALVVAAWEEAVAMAKPGAGTAAAAEA